MNWFKHLKNAAEASRAAGEAYDQQKAAAAALEAEQQRLVGYARSNGSLWS